MTSLSKSLQIHLGNPTPELLESDPSSPALNQTSVYLNS